MFTLPLVTPRPNARLWPSHRDSNHLYDTASDSPQHAHHHGHNRRPESRHNYNNGSSFLAALAADENALEQRKQNVRNFGAGWIRPPGIAKTLQATEDEKLERQEQEALQQREQGMMDWTAAQQEAGNQQERQEGEQMEELVEPERDLDDDVPEAEAEDSAMSPSGASSSVEEAEGDTSAISGTNDPADITFNDDSFIEGSMVEAEVEEMLEREEAEMAGVLQDERDLDDDIPEAGSYEHTDSELEDSSSGDGAAGPSQISTNRLRRRSSGRRISGRRSSGHRHSGRQSSGMLQVPPENRSSFGMEGSSSVFESSSFLRSSPVSARGSLRARFLNAAGRGRGQ